MDLYKARSFGKNKASLEKNVYNRQAKFKKDQIVRKQKFPSGSKSLLSRIRRKKTEAGAASEKLHEMPGALIYTGEETSQKVTLEVIQFDAEEFHEYNIESRSLDEILPNNKILWLNVIGLHDAKLIEQIGDRFDLHNLALEDIMNVQHRPSFDQYEDNLMISVKMLKLNKKILDSEQLSFVIGPDYLITFQEKPGDIFEGVRNRLRKKKGRIRTKNSDYLAFALLDVIVDKYLTILAIYDEEINDQEIRLLEATDKSILTEINSSKKEINYLRKYARPLGESILSFSRSKHSTIDKKTRPYLKDLLDHITHVTEIIELNRETINDNLNAYHSQMSSKLNDILKVLTIFSVVFIPLTFMAGIYGMNFEYMPELKEKYAYPTFWVLLVTITAGMLYYFKRKRWL